MHRTRRARAVTDERARVVRGRQEQERARVERELANIRRKFNKTHRSLTAYERKKYVLKLLYIYMLGYNVDFGHTEALKLISSTSYGEKQAGYMTTSVILNERNEFLRMAINSIRTDVISRDETNQCLGLSCIANVGGREFADSLAGDVETILLTPTYRPVVRKKAALCLLRLFRKNPEILLAETFAHKIVDLLDAERDLGVLIGVLSLLLGIVQHSHRGYESCVPKVINVLERLTVNKDIPPEYLYYGIPSPWLQVKCMKILQYFPTPEDPALLNAQLVAMRNILSGTNTVKNSNKNNALHAILFEAINLVTSMDYAHELFDLCVEILGNFLEMKEPNIRYLALNTLNALAAMPDLREAIKVYQDKVVDALHDADISIRKRALTLLFSMCDASNVHSVIDELVKYFVTADFDIREELAIKTAILAERYSVNDRQWFVHIALQIIDKAGDFINDDLWHRVVQIATSDPKLHASTAQVMFAHLRDEGAANELVLRLVSYCIGEFGYLLPIPASQYVDILVPLFKETDEVTQAIMLTAFVKVAMHKNCDQAAMGSIVQVFTDMSTDMDIEVQQRASEYLRLLRLGPSMRPILEPMPEYPERASILEKHVEVENEASDIAAGVRKLGLSRATDKNRAQPQTPAGTSASVEMKTAPKPAASVDLLGDLLGEAATPAALPAARPAASPGSNLEALLGIGAPALPSTQPPPRALPAIEPSSNTADSARPASTAHNVEDLLGIGGSAAPVALASSNDVAVLSNAVIPSQQAQSPSATPQMPELTSETHAAIQPRSGCEPTVDVDECAKRLLVADNGLLYEDECVQVGVKSQWQGSQGRIMFYVGNKFAAETLQNVRMSVAEVEGLRHSLQPVPATIGPKRQIQIMLQVAIGNAFTSAPTLAFEFTTTAMGAVSRSLALPVRVNKFLRPMTISSPQEFIAMWHQMASVGQQQKIMDVSQQYASSIDRVINAFKGMRLAVHEGLDPNPANIVAGSRFVGEKCGEVFIAVRAESDANVRGRYRFTVASLDATATSAVMETLVQALQ